MHTVSRMCIACLTRKPPEKMIRVVRTKQQVVFLLPSDPVVYGRSAYLCPQKKCILKALDRKGKDAFSFTLKITLPLEIKTALHTFLSTLDGHATA